MKPTVQAPDFYKIGNDYAQAPLSSFFDTSVYTEAEAKTKAEEIMGPTYDPEDAADKAGYEALVKKFKGEYKNYQDGIFTKMAEDVEGWKDENYFNKRRVYADASDPSQILGAGETFGTKDGVADEDRTENAVQPTYSDEAYGKADIIEPSQYPDVKE